MEITQILSLILKVAQNPDVLAIVVILIVMAAVMSFSFWLIRIVIKHNKQREGYYQEFIATTLETHHEQIKDIGEKLRKLNDENDFAHKMQRRENSEILDKIGRIDS